MIIMAEMSYYPLHDDFLQSIGDFIADLRACEGVEVDTNAMSTQLRGEFDAVTTAINHCMRQNLKAEVPAVLVVKYLNPGLDAGRATGPD
jgi:uncharacterized protein YqgV (UPF0045/DUF77 family)